MDFHRKSTDPNLGTSLYNGNVLELKEDADVNIPKVGGLKINNEEVATQNFVTGIRDNLDSTVSQLVTSSSNHNQRLTTIEDSGYVTQSALSIYATSSSLGNTNDTVGGINTRVNTLENAGYITTPALQAYSYATTGQLADYALATAVDTNTTTLSGSVLPAIVALQQQFIPTTTDILNDTNVRATATSGATAGVTMTNKSSGTGVDFTFTIPPGEQGI